MPRTEPTALSMLLRRGSQAEHTEAESSSFMSELVDARINPYGYGQYLLRLRAVYAALEETGRGLADDPLARAVLDPALERLPALDNDLRHWLGDDWRAVSVDSPASDAYVSRIRTARQWGGHFVAHHYTRYLGDLSGGQAIGRTLSRAYELVGSRGVEFYDFPRIARRKPYKDRYRARLDALVLTEEQKLAILDEVKLVFALNGAIFTELGRDLSAYRR